jgi:hypothetical protein
LPRQGRVHFPWSLLQFNSVTVSPLIPLLIALPKQDLDSRSDRGNNVRVLLPTRLRGSLVTAAAAMAGALPCCDDASAALGPPELYRALGDLDPATVAGVAGPALSAFGFLFIPRIVMSWYPRLPVTKCWRTCQRSPSSPSPGRSSRRSAASTSRPSSGSASSASSPRYSSAPRACSSCSPSSRHSHTVRCSPFNHRRRPVRKCSGQPFMYIAP